MGSEVGPIPPLQPRIIQSRESATFPREQQIRPQVPYSKVDEAIKVEFTKPDRFMPEGNFQQKLKTIVLATDNGIKLDSLRKIARREGKRRIVIGRYKVDESKVEPNVEEIARLKALAGYKKLREPEERTAFERKLREDVIERHKLTGRFVFSYYRRRFRKSFHPKINGLVFAANDVLTSIPVVQKDGNVIFEMRHKPQNPEGAKANLMELYQTAIANGWDKIPILSASATRLFSPNHPEHDARSVRKTVANLAIKELGNILTESGFENFRNHLKTNDKVDLTDVSGGFGTTALIALGVAESVEQNTPHNYSDAAKGELDEELVTTYIRKFKPSRRGRKMN